MSDGCPPPSGKMTVSCRMTSSSGAIGASVAFFFLPSRPFDGGAADWDAWQLTAVVASSRRSGSPAMWRRENHSGKRLICSSRDKECCRKWLIR